MILAAHASEAFNQWLGQAVRAITKETRQAMAENLYALVLGGGYGRGEGGVIERGERELPYNDLDFTIVVRDKSRVDQQALAAISSRWAPRLGLHVDFSRPLSPKDLLRLPPWLVWKELIQGHICLAGPEDAFSGTGLVWLDRPLPKVEAAKLLLNRGAGILWALRAAREAEPEPDQGFMVRNYQKCLLAMGEALLILYERHQTPYLGRDALLAELAGGKPQVAELDLLDDFSAALASKFRPGLAPPLKDPEQELSALSVKWGRVFLLVEQSRLARGFSSLAKYAAWPGLREPEEHRPGRLPRNLYRQLQMGKLSWRYPREALYRGLPGLLGLTGQLPENWNQASAQFLKVWNGFN